ncbi:class I SAM-dependent methyltransferase [Streptomyces sp. KL118A]|uniref:class I SAM-dependent methyltransferase n=1 Tax=Streptomyces sp. KL118A TaxID=3045153 RepID=UPI00278C3A72|nr:class I SAM-dependent methyltransferase [Streptomyces sp. KL118A]
MTAAPSRAHSFNAAAAQYAAYRPSYPPALFDAVERLSGRPLAGARVVDVGAGTGIATALLAERGAEVLAVEPGDGMAAQFRRTLPHLPLVRGSGDALPLADGSADLITYAQAWHWTDQERSVPEALRVLRPGGALALWWNRQGDPDPETPWLGEQTDRIARFLGAADDAARAADRAARRAKDLTTALDFHRDRLRWSRRVPLDTHLANLATHSAFLVLGERRTAEFVAQERTELLKVFPDGVVEERYAVDLLVWVDG